MCLAISLFSRGFFKYIYISGLFFCQFWGKTLRNTKKIRKKARRYKLQQKQAPRYQCDWLSRPTFSKNFCLSGLFFSIIKKKLSAIQKNKKKGPERQKKVVNRHCDIKKQENRPRDTEKKRGYWEFWLKKNLYKIQKIRFFDLFF